MIVLRIRLDGVTLDHRLEGGDATLGSGARCTIRATNAGWPSRAATLRQEGTEVRMTVPGRVGTVMLRVGDEVRLGRADLSVVGLLPPEDDGLVGPTEATPAPAAAPPGPEPRARPGAPTGSPPAFGDYVDAEPPRFALDDPPDGLPDLLPRADAPAAPPRPARTATTTPPVPAPPPPPPSVPKAAPSPGRASAGPPAAAARPAAAPPSDSPWDARQEFGEELVAQIKRTPWFALSVAFHVLVFFAFKLMLTRVEPVPVRWGGGTLAGSLMPEHSVADEPSPVEVPEVLDALPEPPAAPEPELDELLERPQLPEPMPLPPEPEEALPPDLGTQPSIAAAGRRTKPRSVPVTAPVPAPDARETFSKLTFHDARKRAARHVLDALGVDKGGRGQALRNLKEPEVLVVLGSFDHHERVLTDLRIPHRTVQPHDVGLVNGSAFDQARFVFWNCSAHVPEHDARRWGERVREFVEGGGYLFTSDWALQDVLMRAFPGLLATGRGPDLREMIVDITPTTSGVDSPLLEGVFLDGLTGRWWLEAQSQDVVVKKEREVTVLVESPVLKKLGRSSAMAVTFRRGRGRVLHVMGHYDQEAGNVAGTIAVQRLALNFVLMGMGVTKEKDGDEGK